MYNFEPKKARRNVYSYCFNITHKAANISKESASKLEGMQFGGDLIYTFAAALNGGIEPFTGKYDIHDKLFNVAMLAYWRNFIHTG